MERTFFGNRWGYDIWGLERCYLGVSKCFRLATTRPPEVHRKKAVNQAERCCQFSKTATEQLYEGI